MAPKPSSRILVSIKEMSALARRWAAFAILPLFLAVGWTSTAGLLACAGELAPASSCHPQDADRTGPPSTTTSQDCCQLAPASGTRNLAEPASVASKAPDGHPLVALARRWSLAIPVSSARAEALPVDRSPSLPVFLSKQSLLL